jgi:ABC-2 type transport system ATP-binding protein
LSIIRAEKLVKVFRVATRRPGIAGALKGLFSREVRQVRALDGISFSVEPGEIVGYIGPNGAGKSTTVKILSGILVPDSGHLEVSGRTPWIDRIAHVRGIGVVFGQRTQLWWDLPVQESFELLKEIYAIPAAEYARSFDELVNLLALEGLLDTPVRQLSLGERMRADIAAALLHRPALLFLDEPTIGLDAVAKLSVRAFIRKLASERGTTVLLTTHSMDDVEALCSRILVLGDGAILYDGTLAGLALRVTAQRRLVVELSDAGEVTLPGAELLSREGERLVFGFDPRQCSAATLIAHLDAHHQIRDLMVENPPVEELVARLYKGLNR